METQTASALLEENVELEGRLDQAERKNEGVYLYKAATLGLTQ
jgi:hypothetical protein